MDSRRRLSPLLILSLIAAVSPATSSESEKVSLVLYYETLCPYCSNFIVNYLPELFNSGLISVVDLKLSPYGNAKVSSDGSITCQHGEMECLLNTVEACAIDVWPEVGQHFHFVYCVESLIFNKKSTEWETCFDTLGLDRTPVDECYSSGHGTKLELSYANETAALEPPHQYVPWVTVNGQPLYDDYQQFMSFICEAYKGSSLPKACNDLPVIRKGPVTQVSYKENFSRKGKFYSSEEYTSIETVLDEDEASV